MWGVDGATREDHFLVDLHLVSFPMVKVGYAHGTGPFKEDPRGQGMGFHGQIWPIRRGSQEGGGCATPLSVLLGDMIVAKAFLHWPIEVVIPWEPSFDTGIHKGTR